MSLTLEPRATWLAGSGLAWIGSPGAELRSIRYAVIHWPGANIRVTDRPRVITKLRQMHAADLGKSDPMNVGYNFAVDPSGVSWELRGLTARNAANGSKTGDKRKAGTRDVNWNVESISVNVLCDLDGSVTGPQLGELRALIDHLGNVLGRTLEIVGHQEGRTRLNYDSTSTACPGPTLMTLIRSGDLNGTPTAPTPPPANSGQHTVVSGDTWWGIARRYGVTLPDLLVANPPIIRPGDVIKLPGGAK